jgi:hypothetical protein
VVKGPAGEVVFNPSYEVKRVVSPTSPRPRASFPREERGRVVSTRLMLSLTGSSTFSLPTDTTTAHPFSSRPFPPPSEMAYNAGNLKNVYNFTKEQCVQQSPRALLAAADASSSSGSGGGGAPAPDPPFPSCRVLASPLPPRPFPRPPRRRITDFKQQFDQYDEDKSGTVECVPAPGVAALRGAPPCTPARQPTLELRALTATSFLPFPLLPPPHPPSTPRLLRPLRQGR